MGSAFILNFHRVAPRTHAADQAFLPEHFRQLVRHLARDCRLTTLAGLRQQVDRRPLVVLSFDDGYRDFLEYAAPILDEVGAVANVNVIPSCALSNSPPWTSELFERVGRATTPQLKLLPESLREAASGALDRARTATAVVGKMKSRPRRDVSALMEECTPFLQATEPSGLEMLSVDEIKGVAAQHELGIHSWAHDSMAFESDAYFLEDLQRCERFFAENRMETDIYAFPNGSYRADQVEALRTRGYLNVLLVGERSASPAQVAKSRITMYADSLPEARLRALAAA